LPPLFFALTQAKKSGAVRRGKAFRLGLGFASAEAKKSGAVRMATFYYMDENRKAAKKIAFHFSFNFLRKDLVM